MKIPALRANIGDWEYYVTTLTFEQVSLYVSKIDDQLHKSESLKDLIQRSITNNFLSIKEYIIKQPSVFFNSLVLAVYDDYPNWQEIEFKYEDIETYKMGLLDFPSDHKIFPVDGQHRVEGIKAALEENPELKDQQIAAIFIGHKNDELGKQRTRRLFTTLNRYAKPVSLDDIIALDEDDSIAITTRFLLEEYKLFTGKKVVYAKQKAIPYYNKDAITSIITLYQANEEIFKIFFENKFDKKPTKSNISKYLKFRPKEEEIDEFRDFSIRYWDAFKEKLLFIKKFEEIEVGGAVQFRNNEDGGNLLFRPVGLLPFVKASIAIYKRSGKEFEEIFEQFNSVNFNINNKPWRYVVWNPIQHKMIMNSSFLTYLLLIYLFDENLIFPNESIKLKEGYAAKISYEGDIETVLMELK